MYLDVLTQKQAENTVGIHQKQAFDTETRNKQGTYYFPVMKCLTSEHVYMSMLHIGARPTQQVARSGTLIICRQQTMSRYTRLVNIISLIEDK